VCDFGLAWLGSEEDGEEGNPGRRAKERRGPARGGGVLRETSGE